MKFDNNLRYVFKKEKYFKFIELQGRRLSSVEKNFGRKYDNKIVKVIDENHGVVEGIYQVMRDWCEEIN